MIVVNVEKVGQDILNNNKKFRSFKSKENMHKKERRWARLYSFG